MLQVRKTFVVIVLLKLIGTGKALYAQDTLKVMHYNLLRYGNITSYCHSGNNNINEKDIYLRDITAYVEPDVFCVNEMGADVSNAERLLDTVLNENGITHYKRAGFTNNASSDIVNMLFYNSDKLTLHSQEQIYKDLQGNDLVRVIDLYRVYVNSSVGTGDTIFITFINAHLKAGNTNSEQVERNKATEALMANLNAKDKAGNYILSGDLNLYKSSEPAFQNLINYHNIKMRFFDPAAMLGSWSGNENFSGVHTQSTRGTETNSGCFSGGGMDDRFDFILASDYIMNDSALVRYVPDSYTAIGQDGFHFDQALNSTQNNSAPPEVMNALYNMSDHLPVTVKLAIGSGASSIKGLPNGLKPIIVNPVFDKFDIKLELNSNEIVTVKLHTLSGKMLMEDLMIKSGNRYIFNKLLDCLSPGMYIVQITTATTVFSSKVIKVN